MQVCTVFILFKEEKKTLNTHTGFSSLITGCQNPKTLENNYTRLYNISSWLSDSHCLNSFDNLTNPMWLCER